VSARHLTDLRPIVEGFVTVRSEHSVALLNGDSMPLVGFGTWQIQGRSAYESVRRALDVGYRHLDTATVYENESEVGRALKESAVARDDCFVTTKVPPFAGARARATLESSLRKLDTDYVDLWLIHWPENARSSLSLWQEMTTLADEGKARAIGVSNFSLGEIDDLVRATEVTPAVNQIRWSPFLYDAAEAAGLSQRGVVLEGYSPLKESFLFSSLLVEIGEHHGVTPAQVVLRWHVQHDVVVIPKSVHAGRIAENFDLFSFNLDETEMSRLDALGEG
jgi:diketogulonate reductase-like aldo/keto reductase